MSKPIGMGPGYDVILLDGDFRDDMTACIGLHRVSVNELLILLSMAKRDGIEILIRPSIDGEEAN